MKVTLPCIKAAGKNVVVYFVDGTKSEAMKTTENDDGTVTFETTHNSVYVVSYEDIPPVPPTPPEPTKQSTNLYAYAAIVLALILLIATVIIPRIGRKA